MMYQMNWMLTNAQIELLAADVSVVDDDYGEKKDKKRKKGDYDNTKASSEDVRKAGKEWLDKYGNGENAGMGLSMSDILGNKMKAGIGVVTD